MSHDAKHDAETIHKAIKGVGTDEKALNSIYGNRTKNQLIEIAKAYEAAYKTPLEKDIKGDTGGHYETLLVYLAKPAAEVRAHFLKYATKGAGTKEKYITDALVPCSNKEVTDIFHTDPTAIGAVTDDVSKGDWAKAINKVLKGVRDESGKVDDHEAEKVAEQLYKAGEGKIGTDEGTFIDVIASKSPAFLKRVSHHYQAKHKHTLEQAIKKENSGDFEDVLVGLCKTKHEYFADRFWNAVSGLGTDDHFLCLAFGVLSWEDLHEVSKIFHERHSDTTLAKKVADDVSGHFGDLIKQILTHAK
jgi:hypothetical protein